MSQFQLDFTAPPAAPQGGAPPPPLLPPPPRRSRSYRRWPLAAALLLVVALVAALAVSGVADGLIRSDQPASSTFLVSASGHKTKIACVDSSASVDQDGHLASVASGAIVEAVRGLYSWPKTPPSWKASPPAPAMTITARVVRKDSYSTTETSAYVVSTELPEVHGLSSAQPGADDVKRSAAWADDAERVQRDMAASTNALKVAGTQLHRVLARHSNGSDVIGCVGASLEASGSGTTPDILIVSDLQDRALVNSNGSVRGFKGDWTGASVQIVQACPSGDQAACQRTSDAFSDRLARLGVTNVKTYRPEQLATGVTTWLAPQA